jgi:hypothetical protein
VEVTVTSLRPTVAAAPLRPGRVRPGTARTRPGWSGRAPRTRALVAALAVVLVGGATAPATAVAAEGDTAVLVGAADVGWCGRPWPAQTAKLVAAIPGTVIVPGDVAYPRGTRTDFAKCYAPTWGKFRGRTRPAPGNHEYYTKDAAPYFSYFGSRAGRKGKGWYSYDAGTWHVIVLNSNCAAVGGCGPGSAQEGWLRADLAAHPVPCTIAYFHHPRFSSGPHGPTVEMDAFWRALHDAGAEIVVNGHDHDYERFAPQTPDGALDAAGGIREFVVGTGGAPLYPFIRAPRNSEARGLAHGVLKLTLRPGAYDWAFVPVAGSTFTDAGSGTCH